MVNSVGFAGLEERKARHYADSFWRDETIYQLAVRNAEAAPSSPALRDSDCRLGWRELVDYADNLANDLAARGTRRGDRVGIWLPSRVETAAALLACARNGYVCCPSLHRNHTVDEVAALLRSTGATTLIMQPGYGAGGDENLFDAGGTFTNVYRLEPEATFTTTAPASRPAPPEPDDVVYMAFTSGTGSAPKRVMHSHNTLLSNARTIAADWHFDRHSVIYTMSPLSHNLGFGALICAIAVGAELVVHDPKNTASLVERLRETGATFLFGVPAHAMDLLAELEKTSRPDLGLRGFRISGAAVPGEVVRRLIEHGVMPQSGYGMTEACSHHYTLPDDEPERIIETSGRACPGYEVQIFAADDRDRKLPIGEIGEIGGRGASLMLGYFDDPAANADALNAEGWFMTGDLGCLDEHGYLKITGRKKDVIIRGGHNIYPARIETLAMRHHDVEQAAAVPVADGRLGERVCLVVKTGAGAEVMPEQVLEHLDREGLSKYDMPEFFATVDEMPVTATGKTVKRTLVARINDRQVQVEPVRWQQSSVKGN